MQLTNREVFSAKEPLEKLLEEKFPVKVSYGLAKLASKLNDQFEIIEKVRNGLVKTYGEADEDNQVIVKSDSKNFPKFAKELDELFEQKIELVVATVMLPEKVTTTCDKCSHTIDKMFEIEPSILMALDKFILVE